MSKLIGGESPLHIAAELGNLDIIECLIEAGANLDAENDYGDTPLFYGYDNPDVVDCLIEAGADASHLNKKGYNYLNWETLEEIANIPPPVTDNTQGWKASKPLCW